MLNDELSDLAIFAAVADARSFTRAAARLGKSQSALSQSVRRLEERLKLRLLTRTTRSVMPTPAGEQLLGTLRPALGEIEAQLNALSELRELPSGSLRLTAGRHAVETVLWPALLRLNTRYPDIKCESASHLAPWRNRYTALQSNDFREKEGVTVGRRSNPPEISNSASASTIW